MPQVLAATLVKVGLSKLLATVVSTVVFVAATTLVSRLLTGAGGARAEQTERTVKSPTPVRSRGYGARRLFGAQMAFDTASNGTTVDVLAFHDGKASALLGVYLNDELAVLSGTVVQPFPDGSYGAGLVNVGVNLGEATETAFSAVISLLSGIWTSAHRGDGIVSAYLTKAAVKADQFLKIYPQGDQVELSLALELQCVFDPRDEAQDPDDSETWTYSENAALQLLHFYLTERGYGFSEHIEPVLDYWTAAADVCDEAVELAGGGTEPRYRGCVVYEATARPANVISELLACFDGWTDTDENGCVRVYAGALYEPTVSLGPQDIAAYSHQAFVEEENRVNELVIQYVSAAHKYSTVEGQSWRDEADISERGRIISDGITLQIPSHTQARRLAKRAMLRRNSPDRGSVTTLISGRSVIGERYINLTIEEAGAELFSGAVEIVALQKDAESGGVTFEWVAVPEGFDDWDEEVEDGAGAEIGEFVPRDALDDPSIVSAEYFESGADSARIRITGSGPVRDDLTWFVRWRTVGSTLWGGDLEYSDVDAGISVVLETDVVPVGPQIEVQIRYQVGDGRYSEWSATETVITAVFDFTGGSLPSGATLTRGSAGTYFNVAGVLQSAATNVARFDHDPVSHAPLGLLIERASTNLLTNSQAFDNAAVWTVSNVTVTANSTAAPDGTTTADTLAPTGSGPTIYQGPSGPGGSVAMTMSLWLKSATGSSFTVAGRANGSGVSPNPTNWSYGTVTTSWQRLSGALVAAAGASTINTGIGNFSTGWANGNNLYAWGAQLETGALTSYMPSGSRSADALVLDWSSRGIADGSHTVRYTFDDATYQDVSTTVASGTATVPTNLNRRWIKSAVALT
jgi:hypothetical protein